MQTPAIDVIALVSALSSAFAAVAALITVFYLRKERQSDMKKDFVLWSIERLRDPGMREGRRTVYTLKPEEWEELQTLARERKQDPRLETIRLICLSFDEIGYFVYKVGLVNYRDILDMYPQAVRIWNKVYELVKIWRALEDANTFLYFEMLARQERLGLKQTFEEPRKLYTG